MTKKLFLAAAVCSAIVLTGCKNNNTKKDNSTTEVEKVVEKGVSGEYKVDTDNAVVEWVGSKPAGKHNGTVKVKEGKVTVKDGVVTSGEFVLDMNTITVLDLTSEDGKENLEDHLKGTGKEDAEDHFFNVKQFPTATFVLKSFDGTNVNGDLTVKGKTKTIAFPASVSVSENEFSLVSEPFKINRTDFGVNYASKSIFDNLKDKFIDDEIELTVKAKATK